MSRKLYLVLFIAAVMGAQTAAARPQYESEANQYPPAAPASAHTPASAGAQDDIPHDIRNNEYFLESQRLVQLAEETYQYGDYDASFNYANDAIYYALLSDVYVAIAVAEFRLNQAVSTGASRQYPAEFGEAQAWYRTSVSARDEEEWEDAIDAANKVVEIVAHILTPGAGSESAPLPASYTVRAWATFRDCFWIIAGRPWVYGDSHKWRVLYNANKAKLPNPDDPNIIEPGMVLDIPSVQGETREGAWDPNKNYQLGK